MEQKLAKCSKCSHAKWEGTDCRYCLDWRKNALLKRMSEPKEKTSEFFGMSIKKIEKLKPYIEANRQLRDELKTKLEMPHFMADYVVATWYLGHNITFKSFNDEQLMHINAGMQYLNENYGSYKKGR